MDVAKLYKKLLEMYGPQDWWPIYLLDPDLKKYRLQHKLTYGIPWNQLAKFYTDFRDPYFEIAIGAILTQNVAWKNVAQAIINLYKVKALRPEKIVKMETKKLENLLIPTRYYTQKAKKLKLFSEWLISAYNGNILNLKSCHSDRSASWRRVEESLDRTSQEISRFGHKTSLEMTNQPIRKQLLAQWGIGKETADSIMLYALNLPQFMSDIYTVRLCNKYGLQFDEYDGYSAFFTKGLAKMTKNMPTSEIIKIYQEYHALIVASGQEKHNRLQLIRSPLTKGKICANISNS